MTAEAFNTDLAPDPDAAVAFLELLRPNGPWVLTAIVPDGPTITKTLTTAAAVKQFVCAYNSRQNVYFLVNPAKHNLARKASKANIAKAEFLFIDIDPYADEPPQEFKARILPLIEAFQPQPTFVVDSGNGIQLIWRLRDSVALSGAASIEDIEERNYALAEAFGADPSTRNVDRILRLPGTVNWPNAKKRRLGRVPCRASLLARSDEAHPLDEFPVRQEEASAAGSRQETRDGDRLDDVIANGRFERFQKKGGTGRSEAVWWVINEMLRRGYREATIKRVLLDRANAISAHIYDQHHPEAYAARQIEQAKKRIELERSPDGHISNSQNNIRIALLKLGVALRYDKFADRILLDGLDGFGPTLDDAAANRLWLLFDRRFKFRPSGALFQIVLSDTAHLNSFHPVREYLDGLKWDGNPRLDSWMVDYGGAEDSAYVRAVGALALIAAVRRIRQPGCKFDEMVVLENPLQGTNKSSALTILAVREEWFLDDLPLNADTQKVIERLDGRWIVEAAELSGMRKADVEHLKSMLSRTHDRARLAYGHFLVERARQCVFIGTTNKLQYLRDTSGNRRYWPISVKTFNLDRLRQDRDQLWAEAAHREAAGESIRLPRELWPEAEREQGRRLADDPFMSVLAQHLGDKEGKIRATSVWEILDLRGGQLTQDIFMRSAEAMKRIGWRRPNKSGQLRFGSSSPQCCFVRGEEPYKEIYVYRHQGRLFVSEKPEQE